MFGKNPIRAPLKGNGKTLEVEKIFPTIQGEGPNAGQPATFIRLGGCNLACKFCDTEFENFKSVSLSDILGEVKKHPANLIVITGGEPFRQPIEKLCKELLALGKKVQIETNGTLFRNIPREVEIVCSPKTSEIRADIAERVTAYKFLISANIPEYQNIKFRPNKPVFVQPMDEYDPAKNAANFELATKLALGQGYNLSIQLHKLIGVE